MENKSVTGSASTVDFNLDLFKPKAKEPPGQLRVGYHESGILTPETGTKIVTGGLKPCVAVLLVAPRLSDGKPVAALMHFAPQFLNHSESVQPQHLDITEDLLKEGLDKLRQKGADMSKIQGVLSGETDFRGRTWNEMTISARNAHNVISVLGRHNIDQVKQHYGPSGEYRQFEYDIAQRTYQIKDDSPLGDKSIRERQIVSKGRI